LAPLSDRGNKAAQPVRTTTRLMPPRWLSVRVTGPLRAKTCRMFIKGKPVLFQPYSNTIFLFSAKLESFSHSTPLSSISYPESHRPVSQHQRGFQQWQGWKGR